MHCSWLFLTTIYVLVLEAKPGNLDHFRYSCLAVGTKHINVTWNRLTSKQSNSSNLAYSYALYFCKDYDSDTGTCSIKFKLGCNITSTLSIINTCDIGEALDLDYPYEYKFAYHLKINNGIKDHEGGVMVCHVNLNMKCTDPTGLTLSASDKKQLTLSWDPPSSMGHFSGLCYRIKFKYGSDYGSKFMGNATYPEVTNFSLVLYSLMAYHYYEVWLQCAVACSDYALWSDFVGPIKARTLEEVPDGRVVIDNYDSKEVDEHTRNITVNVKLPAKSMWNGNITHVLAYCYKGKTLCTQAKVPPHQKSISFNSLKRNEEYYVVAQYCNSEGCSRLSNQFKVNIDIIPPTAQTEKKIIVTSSTSSTLTRTIVILVVVGVVVIVVVSVGCAIYRRRRRHNDSRPKLENVVGELEISNNSHGDEDDHDDIVDLANSEYAHPYATSRATLDPSTTDFRSASGRSLNSFNISFDEARSSLQEEPAVTQALVHDELETPCETIELSVLS